jgi:hypothetical protein
MVPATTAASSIDARRHHADRGVQRERHAEDARREEVEPDREARQADTSRRIP